jgi:hypothetical protein
VSRGRGVGIVRVGAVKQAVGKGADTAKMVEVGRKEKHILVNKRLDDGRVGRGPGRATPELLPFGKVMGASSGNRCKRCITLISGRRRDGHIDNSIVGRGRSRVALVMRVKLEANVGRAGVGGGGNEIFWFVGDGITGGDKAGKGTEFAACWLFLRHHGWHCWGRLCGIGR